MQTDLDTFFVRYNTERPHQGYGMKGRTPTDVFVRCLPEPKTPKEEKMKKAALAGSGNCPAITLSVHTMR